MLPWSPGFPPSVSNVPNCSHEQTMGSPVAEGAGRRPQGRASPTLPGDPGDSAIQILLQLGDTSSPSAGFFVATKKTRALLFLSHPTSC